MVQLKKQNFVEEKISKLNYKDVVFDSDYILLTDSNGKNNMTDKLAKGVTCKRLLCYTYGDVMELLKQVAFVSQPKKIFINIGTNDIEFADGISTDVFPHVEETITAQKKHFPSIHGSICPQCFQEKKIS